jgi:membrane-bound lytic murein transglycosylase MltF
MITNIYLKSQPKKKISYPDCYILFGARGKNEDLIENVMVLKLDWTIEAEYSINLISRIEFRPS